jgi:hypothetical protein
MPRHRAPLLVATTLLLAMASPVVSAGGVTERVSISAAGEPANADNHEPSLSGGDRFVVFSSSARNLVPGDTNGKSDVFVRDLLETGTTTLEDPGHVSGNAAITPDGHFIVFGSAAPGVVQGHPIYRFDVCRRDRRSSATTLLSVTPDGDQGLDESGCPFVSDDGTVVAFIAIMRPTNQTFGEYGGRSRYWRRGSCGLAEQELLLLLEVVHVQVAAGFQPILMGFDGECTHQAQATLTFGKMRTTWVRRLISSLSRSSMFVDFLCLRCCRGSR